jgi:FixJ family two-component response regulator
MGFNVRTFSSAKDFLDQECQNLPGCLVLDVKMPGMDGLELQQKLIDCGSKMPIIFMSAHEDISAYEQGLRAGALAFIQKPFDALDIIELVKSALNGLTNRDKSQGRNENDR